MLLPTCNTVIYMYSGAANAPDIHDLDGADAVLVFPAALLLVMLAVAVCVVVLDPHRPPQ